MRRSEITAHARREIREAQRTGMPKAVADAMRAHVDAEGRRYEFAIGYATGLASGSRKIRDDAHRRFCAAVFAVADVARSFSTAAMGRGGSKVRAD